MSVRRLVSTTTLILLLVGLTAVPVMAQFTPRFSTQKKGPPHQWHIGFGSTVVNLGDHSNEYWPVLNEAVPILQLRLGVAIPLKGETLFLLPEVEAHFASTYGEYVDPQTQIYSDVNSISQQGFSVLLSVMKTADERRTLWGGGLGYYTTKHNPVTPESMGLYDPPLEFFRDPFMHMGIGMQLFAARSILSIREDINLMLEGRYKVALMDGISGEIQLLMSEFIISAFLTIK